MRDEHVEAVARRHQLRLAGLLLLVSHRTQSAQPSQQSQREQASSALLSKCWQACDRDEKGGRRSNLLDQLLNLSQRRIACNRQHKEDETQTHELMKKSRETTRGSARKLGPDSDECAPFWMCALLSLPSGILFTSISIWDVQRANVRVKKVAERGSQERHETRRSQEGALTIPIKPSRTAPASRAQPQSQDHPNPATKSSPILNRKNGSKAKVRTSSSAAFILSTSNRMAIRSCTRRSSLLSLLPLPAPAKRNERA